MRLSWLFILVGVALVVFSATVFLTKEEIPSYKKSEMVSEKEITSKGEAIVIGKSVEERVIEAFTFGDGEKNILFVGGIHGGYEWNSVVLAYEIIDYLKQNPQSVPSGVSVTIIPNANPDGVFPLVRKDGRFNPYDIIEGINHETLRFNANKVDLNRNFDCKWQAKSTWKSQEVSAGSAPFSEPESVAIRDFVLREKPRAVVFWHSKANAVYASECENGILAETREIMNAYSFASGYKAVDSFDAYSVTGDAEGWLASIGIPAITVELSTHEDTEFDKNLAGVKAVLSL